MDGILGFVGFGIGAAAIGVYLYVLYRTSERTPVDDDFKFSWS